MNNKGNVQKGILEGFHLKLSGKKQTQDNAADNIEHRTGTLI